MLWLSCLLTQAWRVYVSRMKRNHLAVVAQLQHTWAVRLLSILLRWRGYTSYKKRLQASIAKFIATRYAHLFRACFGAWKAFIADIKFKRSIVIAGVSCGASTSFSPLEFTFS